MPKLGSEKYLNPYLRALWRYDPETGNFYHLLPTQGRGGIKLAGDRAGTLKDGYVQLGHGGITYRAHILAWVWMKGELPPKGKEIDHEDTNRANNRWLNLRLLDRGGNNLNYGGLRSNNTSGVRGVHKGRQPGTWFARITVDKEIVHLGTYRSFEDAVAARQKAEAIYWELTS